MRPDRLRATLNAYFEEIDALILDKQHPVTGLLPASIAVTIHGDYRGAWVRDNVYSIMDPAPFDDGSGPQSRGLQV